jgi:hypothetical protein
MQSEFFFRNGDACRIPLLHCVRIRRLFTEAQRILLQMVCLHEKKAPRLHVFWSSLPKNLLLEVAAAASTGSKVSLLPDPAFSLPCRKLPKVGSIGANKNGALSRVFSTASASIGDTKSAPKAAVVLLEQ